MRQQRRINQSGKHTTAHFFLEHPGRDFIKMTPVETHLLLKWRTWWGVCVSLNRPKCQRCLGCDEWASQVSQQTFFNCIAFFCLCCAQLKALDDSVFQLDAAGKHWSGKQIKSYFFGLALWQNSPDPSVEDAWNSLGFLHNRIMHVFLYS